MTWLLYICFSAFIYAIAHAVIYNVLIRPRYYRGRRRY